MEFDLSRNLHNVLIEETEMEKIIHSTKGFGFNYRGNSVQALVMQIQAIAKANFFFTFKIFFVFSIYCVI